MNTSNPPTVREFMTPDPCGIDEDLTLADAADRMLANNIRHLLVLREGQLIGLVDSADIALANAVTGDNLRDVRLSKAVRGVFRCPPDMPVTDVVRTMERNHYGCAAIVDASHHVVGIFTIVDALRALRQVVAGQPVRPEIEPTHVTEVPPQREHIEHPTRVSRMLKSHRAAPSPNQGMPLGSVGLSKS